MKNLSWSCRPGFLSTMRSGKRERPAGTGIREIVTPSGRKVHVELSTDYIALAAHCGWQALMKIFPYKYVYFYQDSRPAGTPVQTRCRPPHNEPPSAQHPIQDSQEGYSNPVVQGNFLWSSRYRRSLVGRESGHQYPCKRLTLPVRYGVVVSLLRLYFVVLRSIRHVVLCSREGGTVDVGPATGRGHLRRCQKNGADTGRLNSRHKTPS